MSADPGTERVPSIYLYFNLPLVTLCVGVVCIGNTVDDHTWAWCSVLTIYGETGGGRGVSQGKAHAPKLASMPC